MKDKIINDYNKLRDKITEIKDYLVAFDKCCPQGELAKEQAIKEFTKLCNQTKYQIDKLRNRQVAVIYER